MLIDLARRIYKTACTSSRVNRTKDQTKLHRPAEMINNTDMLFFLLAVMKIALLLVLY